MSGTLEICNDGERHRWRPNGNHPDGMVCAGCGVSEAELDYLIRRAEIDHMVQQRKAN
jgi:hypothetical protein